MDDNTNQVLKYYSFRLPKFKKEVQYMIRGCLPSWIGDIFPCLSTGTINASWYSSKIHDLYLSSYHKASRQFSNHDLEHNLLRKTTLHNLKRSNSLGLEPKKRSSKNDLPKLSLNEPLSHVYICQR